MMMSRVCRTRFVVVYAGGRIEGEDAKEEHQRMSDEDSRNMFNMALGLGFKYRDDAASCRSGFRTWIVNPRVESLNA